MKKTKKVKVEQEVYYSDISGEEIKEYDDHFNKCTRCGKDITDAETGETQDDGTLCIECTKAGYEFKYDREGGGVGIVNKKGKYVNAHWW